MELDRPRQLLRLAKAESLHTGPGHVLIRVRTSAVCRSDLHIVDGALPRQKLPMIPGYQIVGEVRGIGPNVVSFRRGDRAGGPWLG